MSNSRLISQVFKCSHCAGSNLPFKRCGSGTFYRFPPIIGAFGKAPILFVGINPRVSDSNADLHDSIVVSRKAFGALARNRVGKGAYIARDGPEPHYYLHVDVADRLFPGVPFESIAAVTELHFCASEDSAKLPSDSSRCADRYLGRVLEIVSPTVVFAVGRHVEATLQARAKSWTGKLVISWATGAAPVLFLPHPNSRGPKEEQGEQIRSAIAKARKYLREREATMRGLA